MDSRVSTGNRGSYRRPVRRSRRRRSHAPKLLALAIILLLVGLGTYTMLAGSNENYSDPISEQQGRSRPGDSSSDDPLSLEDADTPYDEAVSSEPPIPLTPMSTRNIIDTGYLALINHNHPAPSEPDESLISPVWPTVAVSRIDDMYLHMSALRAVAEMFTSARAADLSALFVSSGFRDFYRQAYLYGDGSNSEYVMPPGFSEHHTGLAADILAVGIGMLELSGTPEGRWLAANSYRYGLILRYPQWAEAITGINYEPWHFRYVGRVHAYYMMQNDFVLEEYITYIHQQGHFYFEKNGVTHYVFHQTPQEGMIYVPEGQDFIVSSDNKGGYIIWTIQ